MLTSLGKPLALITSYWNTEIKCFTELNYLLSPVGHELGIQVAGREGSMFSASQMYHASQTTGVTWIYSEYE